MGSIKRSMSKREHEERPIQQCVESGGQKAEHIVRERERSRADAEIKQTSKHTCARQLVQPKQTSFALPHTHKHRPRESGRERDHAKRAMRLCKLSRSLPELNSGFWFSRRLRLLRFWRVRRGVTLREFYLCSYPRWRSFKIYKNNVYNSCSSITSMFCLVSLTQL